MKALLVALLVVAAAGIGRAQTDQRREGNWWRSRSPLEKKFYLGGVFDGLAQAQSMREILGAPAKDKWDIQPAVIQALANRRGEQLVDGLDSFYENFANRSIQIPEALFAVCAATSGATQEDIKRIVEAMRWHATVIQATPEPK